MKKFLEIEVLMSERTVGSWKAIAEQVEKVLGRAPVKDRGDDGKMGLNYHQAALSLLQPDFERGIHPTDQRFNQFGNYIEIRKGDWVLRTSFGGLVLTDEEYRTFIREYVR